MGLRTYRQKRDFRRTPEPRGRVGRRAGRSFTIQEHHARRLHWDFRLEIGGVLKSWAVPKGPSLDPRDKRLAAETEDHPLEYGAFEGEIPRGEYGAGTVILWDRGTWEPLGDPAEMYAKGRLKFRLHGKKLLGAWSLVRLRDGDNWLLIKSRDEHAREGVDVPKELAGSVSEGLPGRVWRSTEDVPDPSTLPGARKSAIPDPIRPQLPTPARDVPMGERWLHEIQYEGYRALCRFENKSARFFAPNGREWSLEPVAEAMAGLPARDAIFDGEIVAIEKDGTTSLQGLNAALEGRGREKLAYFVFDLLSLNGWDLRGVPLEKRKAVLEKIVGREGPIRYSDHLSGKGEEFFREACRFAVEGVVSKRRDAPYEEGRSKSWVQVRCLRRQPFVIGGYIVGKRSLVLGVLGANGARVYAGRVAVPAGVIERLKPLETDEPTLDRAPRAAVRWVRPELVAEVGFSGWTSKGHLKNPVYRGLREDKSADEIVRESPAPVGPDSPSVGGVRLSNPDRILYPKQGITKRRLALYYEKIAPRMLPQVADRPLMVVRCPSGRGAKCFHQKHVKDATPKEIDRVEVDGEPHLCISDLAGLIALVQMGVLEIHVWGARVDKIERPDRIVFDLDPSPEIPWDQIVEAAFQVRGILEDRGLASFPKTTGGKGLHVVVPILRTHSWTEVKLFARGVAVELATRQPERYTAKMSKAERPGKIFVDYLRNGRGATAIAPWSTRARAGAPISVPLSWDQLFQIDPSNLAIDAVGDAWEDPWTGFFDLRQTLKPKA